eukprot:9065367-Alexandrium_andersonii.AAC.1
MQPKCFVPLSLVSCADTEQGPVPHMVADDEVSVALLSSSLPKLHLGIRSRPPCLVCQQQRISEVGPRLPGSIQEKQPLNEVLRTSLASSRNPQPINPIAVSLRGGEGGAVALVHLEERLVPARKHQRLRQKEKELLHCFCQSQDFLALATMQTCGRPAQGQQCVPGAAHRTALTTPCPSIVATP